MTVAHLSPALAADLGERAEAMVEGGASGTRDDCDARALTQLAAVLGDGRHAACVDVSSARTAAALRLVCEDLIAVAHDCTAAHAPEAPGWRVLAREAARVVRDLDAAPEAP